MIYDKLKPEAPEAVKCLQSMGVRVALLTGDNRRTALAIAEAVSMHYQLALSSKILTPFEGGSSSIAKKHPKLP